MDTDSFVSESDESNQNTSAGNTSSVISESDTTMPLNTSTGNSTSVIIELDDTVPLRNHMDNTPGNLDDPVNAKIHTILRFLACRYPYYEKIFAEEKT